MGDGESSDFPPRISPTHGAAVEARSSRARERREEGRGASSSCSDHMEAAPLRAGRPEREGG